MVARVLFPVLPCGGTRLHPQHRATLVVGPEAWKRLVVALQPVVALEAVVCSGARWHSNTS